MRPTVSLPIRLYSFTCSLVLILTDVQILLYAASLMKRPRPCAWSRDSQSPALPPRPSPSLLLVKVYLGFLRLFPSPHVAAIKTHSGWIWPLRHGQRVFGALLTLTRGWKVVFLCCLVFGGGQRRCEVGESGGFVLVLGVPERGAEKRRGTAGKLKVKGIYGSFLFFRPNI